MSYVPKVSGQNCYIYDAQTGRQVQAINRSQGFKSAVCDGEVVTLTLASGRIEVINIRTGQVIRVL